MNKPDYIKWIRQQVGHQEVILNFAGGIVTDDSNRVLLQKRSDKLAWGLPGGAMELGESAVETVQRELKEEVALDVEVDQLFGVYSKYKDSYPNGDQAQTILLVYLIKSFKKLAQNPDDETLDLKWFTKDEIKNLQIVNQQHRDVLNDYFSGDANISR